VALVFCWDGLPTDFSNNDGKKERSKNHGLVPAPDNFGGFISPADRLPGLLNDALFPGPFLF